MKKRFLSLIFTMTLLFSIIPTTPVSAINVGEYTIYIGDQMTVSAASALTGAEIMGGSTMWYTDDIAVDIVSSDAWSREVLIEGVYPTGNYPVRLMYDFTEISSSGFYYNRTLTWKIHVKCPHYSFTSGVVTKQPTASEQGIIRYDCTQYKCDFSKIQYIPALGYKDFTGLEFSDATFEYDGSEKEIAINTLPEGATVTYTSDTANQNKATDAGVYKIKATVSHPDYNDWVKEATLTIKPKNLMVSNVSAKNKTYDGTKKAEVITGSLNGIIGDDEVNIASTTGEFEKIDVGDNIPVNITNTTLGGKDKNNYTLTQPTGIKANITKAPISIKANDIQIIQGSNIPTLTYTVTGGKLFGSDKITGAPATTATGAKLGKFDITKGTLELSSNYDMTFTKGTLTVLDKIPQNITVSDISEKTYGDSSFVITATPDSTSKLAEFTYESSNPDVAEISANGTVTIKGAGETNITVKQAGNETYAAFSKTQKLVVKKVPVTINADAKSKKIGASDPELTYQIVGKLVNGDSITGSLTRKPGEKIGKYDILQGTLAINNNYDVTFNKATFEIFDKTPQNVTVAEIGEKTYGDTAFALTVTPDSASKLTDFTYESSNPDVAEVSADGTVTIKAAGEADITVKQAGNEDYASFESVQKLTVNKKNITLSAINLNEKTATLEGVLSKDTDVSLDFNKLFFDVTEKGAENSTVLVKNLVLCGENFENYTITTESVESTISNDKVISVDVSAEKGTVTGVGNYIKGSEITLTATPEKGYKFMGWYVDSKVISKDATYTFTADKNVVLEAKFSKKSSGGLGGGSISYIVKFDTNEGSKTSNKTVSRNGLLKKPADPTKKGFVFKGWFTDKELKNEYNFDSKVTKSFTLYAAWAEDTSNEIILTIGKKDAEVFGERKSNDVAPVIRNDRTMLPARFVAENLGAKVSWDEKDRKVTITKDDTEIVIIIDSDVAKVNGKNINLDSPAFIENDRTYTPVRFIAENLGAKVDWTEGTQEVTITK